MRACSRGEGSVPRVVVAGGRQDKVAAPMHAETPPRRVLRADAGPVPAIGQRAVPRGAPVGGAGAGYPVAAPQYARVATPPRRSPAAAPAAAAPARKGACVREPTPPARLGQAFRDPTSVAEAVRARSGGRGGSSGVPQGRKDGAAAPHVVGDALEYRSQSYRCWIPTRVTQVDPETGALLVDVRTEWIKLADQPHVLRPRTRPNEEQLDWMRSVVREGRIEEEVNTIFRRHASKEPGGRTGVLRRDDLPAAADALDSFLGISGSLRCLLSDMQENSRSFYTPDNFLVIFWDQLQSTLQEYGRVPVENDRFHRGQDLDAEFEFRNGATLGEGTFGKVKLATHRRTKGKRAVKIIDKRKFLGAIQMLAAEVEHLVTLDHPHICKLYSFSEDADMLYLVMDYCSGGELLKRIKTAEVRRRPLEEMFCSFVMRQIMSAIAYVHARGVVHLDLKPANVMLMPEKETAVPVQRHRRETMSEDFVKPHVVVIDLGVAQMFKPGSFSHERPAGTPYTMAPEVWAGEITPKADIFSCGVMLFELLTCRRAFELNDCSQEGALRFWRSRPSACWDRLSNRSKRAVEICQALLRLERTARPGAPESMQYAFLLQATTPEEAARSCRTTREELVRRLAKLPERSALYVSIAMLVARDWPANQWPTVKNFFHECQGISVGRLEKGQLSKALQGWGLEKRQADSAAAAVDLNGSGYVEWTEFVAACIDLGGLEFEGFLGDLFTKADSDNDSLLSQRDLQKIVPGVSEGLIRDVFQSMTGRTEAGARVDWPTFLQHFRPELTKPQFDELGNEGVLEQAVGMIQGVFSRFKPEPAPPEVEEANLEALAKMGFTNRKVCIDVLRKHRNKISDRCVEEICAACAS